MKKILLLLIIPFLSFGQALENNNNIELQSLKITELENDLEYLKHQLDRHHNQYSLGFGLQLLGGLIIGASGGTQEGIVSGAVICLLGGAITISSDRFFAWRHTDRSNKNKRKSHIKSSDDFEPLIKKLKKK